MVTAIPISCAPGGLEHYTAHITHANLIKNTIIIIIIIILAVPAAYGNSWARHRTDATAATGAATVTPSDP